MDHLQGPPLSHHAAQPFSGQVGSQGNLCPVDLPDFKHQMNGMCVWKMQVVLHTDIYVSR